MKIPGIYNIKKISLLLFIVFGGLKASYSQDSTYVDILDLLDENSIVWVNQIPRLKEDVKKQHKGWLKKLILGEKDIPGLQKPVQAIHLSDKETIIIDQGNGTVFFAEEDKLDIPKIIRKQNEKFSSLVSACLLLNGDLLFTDSRLNGIFKLSANRKKLEEFNQSELLQPTGIAYNRVTDQVWVVETGSHCINILDNSGNRVKTFGQRGVGEGEFNYPTSIWVDQYGEVYVVDALNYRIQRFDSKGNFEFMFGENGNGTGYFASPKGIATDSYGHIYVVDALFHGVQIFDKTGNYLYHFGLQGRKMGEFWMPSGIYIDQQNNIYVADSYNSRIQIFKLDLKE